jgi:signal transduction histidine kinase
MNLERFAERFLPRSLLGQLALVLGSGVLATQLIGDVIWATQRARETESQAREGARQIAVSAVSTVRFFRALPLNYRPVVLDQLREMGGTRFFVHVNHDAVQITDTPDSPLKQAVYDEIRNTLKHELPQQANYRITFSMPDTLQVSDRPVLLEDLPDRWIQANLILKPNPAPVLVIQVNIEPGSWLYLATLMPDPYFLEKSSPFNMELLILQFLTLIAVLVLCIMVVRWVTRSFASLAQAAEAFGKGISHDPLPTTGSHEFLMTARAFSEMEQRIQRYIQDRERLFASISHDLRTPITRLKLRTEMLEDEALKAEYHEDLDDLEMMVKGALQSVKDTDIHENQAEVALDGLVMRLVRSAQQAGHQVSCETEPCNIVGKPLALKRAIGNLLDNAIIYGERADVKLRVHPGHIEITIRDHGPGVPAGVLDRLFQPYLRLPHGRDRNKGGMGLGLGIARSMVNAHGGKLILGNHPEGGLVATIELPRATPGARSKLTTEPEIEVRQQQEQNAAEGDPAGPATQGTGRLGWRGFSARLNRGPRRD